MMDTLEQIFEPGIHGRDPISPFVEKTSWPITTERSMDPWFEQCKTSHFNWKNTRCCIDFEKKFGTLHDFACHPCAGAMLIFSVVYVLPKQVQLKRQKLALYFSVSTFFVDVVRLKSKYKHPSHTGVEPRTWDWKSTVLSSALLELLL